VASQLGEARLEERVGDVLLPCAPVELDDPLLDEHPFMAFTPLVVLR
jgi:hypothetical protein